MEPRLPPRHLAQLQTVVAIEQGEAGAAHDDAIAIAESDGSVVELQCC